MIEALFLSPFTMEPDSMSVSEAGRELNEKKNSWNPFKDVSDAGRTMRAARKRSSARSIRHKPTATRKRSAKKSTKSKR
jgi:hypothetical protein